MRVLLQEPEVLAKRTVFPGSAICAEVGVVPLGETAVTHFYVVGTVTGRRSNEFSTCRKPSCAIPQCSCSVLISAKNMLGVLLPQDAINTSKRWSVAPIPESLSVVTSYPTPILDVKVHSTPRGKYQSAKHPLRNKKLKLCCPIRQYLRYQDSVSFHLVTVLP